MIENCYVYIHRRASDGRIFYVGKGRKKRAWDTKDRNDFWHKTSEKHGRLVEVVLLNLTEERALEMERRLIVVIGLENLTNMTLGGEGSSGFKHTEDTKTKMRIRLLGNSRRKGIKHSDEARQKMSEAQKRITRDEVWRANKSAAMKGRVVTPEHRAKLSAANKGKSPSLACRLAVAEANRRRHKMKGAT